MHLVIIHSFILWRLMPPPGHLVIMQPQMELKPPEHVHKAGLPSRLSGSRKPWVRLECHPCLFSTHPMVVNSGVGGLELYSGPYRCRCKSW